MKLLFVAIVLFFSLPACFSQSHKLDSLKQLLPSLSDSARLDCIQGIGIEYVCLESNMGRLYQPYRDSAEYYSNILRLESGKMNYFNGVARSYCMQAYLREHYIHDFEGQEELAKESLRWYDRTGNKKGIENSLHLMAVALSFQNKLNESFNNIDKSYYWAEKNNNIEGMYEALGFQYESYRDLGEYEKAFEAFQKNQQLTKLKSGAIDTFYEYYVLAELHRRIEDYPRALDYYRYIVPKMDLNHSNIWFRICYPELFALNGKIDSAQLYYNMIDSATLTPHDLRYYLMSKGEFYLLQKRYVEALGCLLPGLKYHREAFDLTYIRRCILDVAKTYVALHQYDSALVFAREVLNLSIQSHSIQNVRDAYETLYSIYNAKHQTDSAFVYYQKYVVQKDIVANQAMNGRLATRNYEQTIAILSKEKQLQQQQIKQAGQQKQLLAVAILVLILLCVVIVWNIFLKRKNEANRLKIAEDKLQLQKLESDKTKAELQQQATELEMQALRAQMNPHFIFNCLSSINRFILMNEADAASDYLTKFSRLVRMVLNYSQRDVILLEDELEMIRLYLDLERLRFKNSFDYDIVFQNNFDAGSVYIPPLLLQPFAENAIWHGLMHKEERGRIEIAMTIEDNFLSCIITDNGIGRKKAEALKSKSAEKQKSMGMQITSKRIALLNKNMKQTFLDVEDIVDEKGDASGTRITLKILYRENFKSPVTGKEYSQSS